MRALKNPEDLLPAENATNAPKEVMRLINWLMSHAAEVVSSITFIEKKLPKICVQDGLFVQEAEGSLVGAIREVSASKRGYSRFLKVELNTPFFFGCIGPRQRRGLPGTELA